MIAPEYLQVIMAFLGDEAVIETGKSIQLSIESNMTVDWLQAFGQGVGAQGPFNHVIVPSVAHDLHWHALMPFR